MYPFICFDAFEEVIHLANGKDAYMAAANKKPADRSPAEQALVDDAKKSGMTDVNNAAHASEQSARYNW